MGIDLCDCGGPGGHVSRRGEAACESDFVSAADHCGLTRYQLHTALCHQFSIQTCVRIPIGIAASKALRVALRLL